MTATSQRDLLGSLRELVTATTRTDCVNQIETGLERLFADLSPVLELEPRGPEPQATATSGERREAGGSKNSDGLQRFALRARGRRLGHIAVSDPDALGLHVREQLTAFADHAAIALDNARMLEDHERRARRDPLTGLLNRSEFQDLLAGAVARTERDPAELLSLAVFDLDHFKSVNEVSGHSAGDRLLRATAAALTAVSRWSDIVFRIGGDEFALLLPGCGAQDATAIAIRAAEAIGRLQGSVGISWGVATIPTDTRTRGGMLAVADATMYERKGHKSEPAAELRRDARSRLEVASRLAIRLTLLSDPTAIAQMVVEELRAAFGYYLAAIHRLDDDTLVMVAAAGRLTEADPEWLAREQPITTGVNGRVARTGRLALIDDTRQDSDYYGSDPAVDPGSELSLPIHVDGEVWGVLNLEQLATHSFDESDVMLAEAVIAQTGAALHRCLLVEELQSSFSEALGVLCETLLRPSAP